MHGCSDKRAQVLRQRFTGVQTGRYRLLDNSSWCVYHQRERKQRYRLFPASQSLADLLLSDSLLPAGNALHAPLKRGHVSILSSAD